MSALHQPRIVEYQKVGGLFFKLSRLTSGLKTLGTIRSICHGIVQPRTSMIQDHEALSVFTHSGPLADLGDRTLWVDCRPSRQASIGQMETVDGAASSLLAWSLRAPRVGGACVNEKRT